jgi:heat shock protein HslJ
MREVIDMDIVAAPQIVDVQWQLVEIETPGTRIQITATDGDATICFTREPHAEVENASHFSGNTGCNTFEGAYRISGDRTLSVISLHPTERYCGDRAFEIEQVYLAALFTTTSYKVQIDQLRLCSEDQQRIITFRKAPQ